MSQLCPEMSPISGHIYRHEGTRGPVWRARYRLPDGPGPPHDRASADRARTAKGWVVHEAHRGRVVRDVLDQAHAGTLPGMVRTGLTFADACAEYLRCLEHAAGQLPNVDEHPQDRHALARRRRGAQPQRGGGRCCRRRRQQAARLIARNGSGSGGRDRSVPRRQGGQGSAGVLELAERSAGRGRGDRVMAEARLLEQRRDRRQRLLWRAVLA